MCGPGASNYKDHQASVLAEKKEVSRGGKEKGVHKKGAAKHWGAGTEGKKISKNCLIGQRKLETAWVSPKRKKVEKKLNSEKPAHRPNGLGLK